jgi:2-oxoglutarate ferredoxin oxidoreductase subunit alpha
MTKRILTTGNEAIGHGAIYAGCRHFFGYPITPQNQCTEFFARELPKVGGVFVQSESETASINMVYGAAAAGVRAMTSTASVGFSLMQEGISHIAMAELPCVVVNVQRGGPGMGTTQTAQMDYLQVTKGGGHGGYRNIVLAPASVQECFDFIQLAFNLADKYRNLVLVLSDGIIAEMAESIELRTLEFDPLPEKEWALKGKARKGGRRDFISCSNLLTRPTRDGLKVLEDKFHEIETNEARYENYMTEDANFILVAYGSSARISKEAVDIARSECLKVGLIRPITLWPFPYKPIRDLTHAKKFLVVEDGLEQMIEDVRCATEGKSEVYFLGATARHLPGPGGMIFPDRVIEEVKKLI